MDDEQPGAAADGPAPGDTPDGAEAAQVEAARQKSKRRRIRPPALVARFPKLVWHASPDWPVVSAEQLTEYPALATDLAVWTGRLEPRFRTLDHQAQKLQNQFWRQQVVLIIGGVVATSLGAVQAALGGGNVGLAVATALLAGTLAGLTVLIRSRRAQQGYLTARLKAEQMKSEYFLFLGRVGDYATGDPLARLLQQVDDIEAAEGTT